MPGINVPGASADVSIEFHVADGQDFFANPPAENLPDDGAIFLNLNATPFLPQADRFSGTSVPGDSFLNPGASGKGNLWDIQLYPVDVDQFLSFGPNTTIRLTSPLVPGGDCIGLVVSVVIVHFAQLGATRTLMVKVPVLRRLAGGHFHHRVTHVPQDS